jgi:hypothetical protein
MRGFGIMVCIILSSAFVIGIVVMTVLFVSGPVLIKTTDNNLVVDVGSVWSKDVKAGKYLLTPVEVVTEVKE